MHPSQCSLSFKHMCNHCSSEASISDWNPKSHPRLSQPCSTISCLGRRVGGRESTKRTEQVCPVRDPLKIWPQISFSSQSQEFGPKWTHSRFLARQPLVVMKLKHFLSSLIRENSNFIATSFQISLWNLRINTHLFPINSFILFHNLLSQHKSFGRWTIGEQKDETDGTPIARTRTIPRTESPQWNPQTHNSNT